MKSTNKQKNSSVSAKEKLRASGYNVPWTNKEFKENNPGHESAGREIGSTWGKDDKFQKG